MFDDRTGPNLPCYSPTLPPVRVSVGISKQMISACMNPLHPYELQCDFFRRNQFLPELEYNIGDDPPAEGEPGPITNF